MSRRAKSIRSGAAICNRKCLLPQPQQQKKNDLGERETGQLLNVVKQCHRPVETFRRKNEIDLGHETEPYF